MISLELENGLKANLWINEEPFINHYQNGKIIVEESTSFYTMSKKMIIELFIPRNHNNYALLGIDFLVSDNDKIKVKLDIVN